MAEMENLMQTLMDGEMARNAEPPITYLDEKVAEQIENRTGALNALKEKAKLLTSKRSLARNLASQKWQQNQLNSWLALQDVLGKTPPARLREYNEALYGQNWLDGYNYRKDQDEEAISKRIGGE